MKQSLTLSQLAQTLEAQQAEKRDFIANSQDLSMEVGAMGSLELQLSPTRYTLTDHAHRQVGERLGIPAKYYDRMRGEAPQLLATNLNHWFSQNPERRMVRTLGGTVRAFLSDRYQPIDHLQVLGFILPVLHELAEGQGLRVESCAVTERKLYLKALFPRTQAEVARGDVVQSGLVLSNSEVGLGAVTIQPLIFRLVCANGMIAEDYAQRRHHVGKAWEAEEGVRELLSDEALEADQTAFLLKVRDVVRATADQTQFGRMVERLRQASAQRLEHPAKAVEQVSQRYRLSTPEGEAILRHLIEGGDLSLWGLANAVTQTAQAVTSYDRATELEGLGWTVATQPLALPQLLPQAA